MARHTNTTRRIFRRSGKAHAAGGGEWAIDSSTSASSRLREAVRVENLLVQAETAHNEFLAAKKIADDKHNEFVAAIAEAREGGARAKEIAEVCDITTAMVYDLSRSDEEDDQPETDAESLHESEADEEESPFSGLFPSADSNEDSSEGLEDEAIAAGQ